MSYAMNFGNNINNIESVSSGLNYGNLDNINTFNVKSVAIQSACITCEPVNCTFRILMTLGVFPYNRLVDFMIMVLIAVYQWELRSAPASMQIRDTKLH